MSNISPCALAALFGLLLGACSGPAATRGAAHQNEHQAVEHHFQHWQSQAANNYVFTLDRQCFCIPSGSIEITVRSGQLQSSWIVREQRPLTPEEQAVLPTTVPELFALVRSTLAEGEATLRVQYDPTWGFPTTIAIDEEKLAFDAGLIFRVTDFKSSSRN